MNVREESLKSSKSLIREAGYSLTLVRNVGYTYDTNTATNVASTSSETVKGLVTSFAKSDIDGNMILADDRKVTFFSNNSTTPKPNDKIVWNGATLLIVRVIEAVPSPEYDSFFICQARA